MTKVRSSYGPLAYFSDIFISGKNAALSNLLLHGFKLQKWNYAPSCNSALAGSATKIPMLKSVIHKCTLSQQLLGFLGQKSHLWQRKAHIIKPKFSHNPSFVQKITFAANSSKKLYIYTNFRNHYDWSKRKISLALFELTSKQN